MKSLKIHAISDTHSRHDKLSLPGGDVLVHAGDVSWTGKLKEVLPFLDWFADQDYAYRVLVPGNHDFFFDNSPALAKAECQRRGIILLNDSGIEIEGVKFWGSPITPEFNDWAFNCKRGDRIRKHWDAIPDDTEVLITHGPAYRILDMVTGGEHVGCYDLWERMKKLCKLKLHVCGHIHEAKGHIKVGDILCVNAAVVDDMYCVHEEGVPTKIILTESGCEIEE